MCRLRKTRPNQAFLFPAVLILALAGCQTPTMPPASGQAASAPRALIYREIGGQTLKAHVFCPAERGDRRPASAILLFHGGGWSAGCAEWTFDAARRFAGLGLVAIAIEYRLASGTNTPIEAISDACAAFRWTRQRAREFNLDPGRVAGYGVSAGGHLVAAVATVGCPSDRDLGAGARPDALLLWSPALDVAADGWFRKLLQGRASASDYSPVERAGASTPPTSIVHGAADTLTPLAGAQRFRDRVVAAGGVCELNVFEGVGHLLTRNLANQESNFDPDPGARADGIDRQVRFLRERGFLSMR